MLIKLLKDHLPWVAPSAAIVFAASGYFDRPSQTVEVKPSTEQGRNLPAYATYSTPTSNQIPAVAAQDAPLENDVVTRLSMVTDSSLQALQPDVTPVTELNIAVARAIQPKVEPAKPNTRAASLQESESAVAFFTEAQSNLLAQESCVNDLRSLSEQARVYFPAGGLTLDESGIAQARLIAALVQDCPGVEIIVEGHSDPSGNPDANIKLSKRRAEQVIQRLGASGLDTKAFTAHGLGSERPSNITGPKKDAYYDRRVEFVVIETGNTENAKRFKAGQGAWQNASCVNAMQRAISGVQIFYTPRSVAARQDELAVAMRLASMAADCPEARLRVIGQHSDDARSGENPGTGRMRAKALMTMLVGNGIDSGEIIMAAPSRSMATDDVSGSRLDFDVIVD